MPDTEPPTPAIAIAGASKEFRDARGVHEVTLSIGAGRLSALLGPSGSGKTTLLRLIAGFEAPDRGQVSIAGRPVAGPGVWIEPEHRRVGMVFQHGALFPHLDVAANVTFGAATRERAGECLALVGLADRAGAYAHELSSGERQRVALARALAADPEVILLDEPFAALDAGLRERLRGEVVAILREAGTSALLVTHDQEEALAVADDLTLLRDGRVEQTGPPEQLYARPRTRWAAEFLGEANLVPARADGGVAECELGRFAVDGALAGPVTLVIRPEAMAVGEPGAGQRAEGVVLERAFFGHDQLLHVGLDSGLRLRCRRLGRAGPAPGARVPVAVAGDVSALAEGHGPAATAR